MNTTIFKAIGLQSHFTILPNATANDTRVSALALGVLSYLLSKPEDWDTSVAELRHRFSSESRNDIRRAMQNLKDAGYARLVPQRSKDGRVRGKVWWVSAFPFSDGTDGPHAGLSVTDGPVDRTSGKPTVGFCDTLQSKDLDKENTQTAHAREDEPETPPQPEDESLCVGEDESIAEEPQAPTAEPEPEPIAEPEPQAEAFAWEAPTCTYEPSIPCPHYREAMQAIEPLVPFRVMGNGQRVHEEVFEAVHRLSLEQITRIYDYRLAQKHSPEVLYPNVTLARRSLDKWRDLSEAWEPDVPPPPPPCEHDTWDLHWEGNTQRCKCGKVVGEGVDPEVMRADVERFAPSWEKPDHVT